MSIKYHNSSFLSTGGTPAPSITSNSGFLSTESKSFSEENVTAQGFSPVNSVLKKWGVDTVRFKFYLSKEQQKEYIASSYKKVQSFNIVSMKFDVVYIYYNLFGQKFLMSESGESYLEFSLPKFLKYQNSAYCDELDLLYYCNKYLAPFCFNEYILLNRIDFACQYSFSSKDELNGFINFLKSVSIRRKLSSQDYCFWKFEERVIRFYDKSLDVQRLKTHKEAGKHYDEWIKTLQFCENNNIGRLEYQLKRDYITKYFPSDCRRVEKIDFSVLRNCVDEMFRRDFPFESFTFSTIRPFREILDLIKSKFQRPDSYLDFICVAQKYGIEEARKSMSRQNYSKLRRNLKDKVGITFEQVLSAGDTILTFPDTSIFEEKEYCTEQEQTFTDLLAKNLLNLQDNSFDFDIDLED